MPIAYDPNGNVLGINQNQNVTTISGVTVSGVPLTGEVLTATSSTTADWQTVSASLNGVTVVGPAPSVNQVLTATSTTTADWETLPLSSTCANNNLSNSWTNSGVFLQNSNIYNNSVDFTNVINGVFVNFTGFVLILASLQSPSGVTGNFHLEVWVNGSFRSPIVVNPGFIGDYTQVSGSIILNANTSDQITFFAFGPGTFTMNAGSITTFFQRLT